LHGICYDFFFMTGQLYTDQEASSDLRGTAQGLITFLTYGVGMFAGSLLSGGAVDFFTKNVGGSLVRNWAGFWLSSALSAFAILIFVLIGFKSHDKVRTKQDQLTAAEA
jgi:MFS family permease